MGTHTWSNLFCNLVAAVVADALEDPLYERVLDRLAEPAERRALVAELFWKNKLQNTLVYWICAISVNQHTLVCNKVCGESRDSVTGDPYPFCDCTTKKCY